MRRRKAPELEHNSQASELVTKLREFATEDITNEEFWEKMVGVMWYGYGIDIGDYE